MLDSNKNSMVTGSFRLERVSPGIWGPSLSLWSVPFSLLAGFYPRRDLLILISGHYSLSLKAIANQPPLST